MSHTLTYKIIATLDHVSGKFASKEEISSQILDELENLSIGILEGDNGGEYEITGWEITELA